MVALDTEVLCQVDNLHVGRDVMLFQESLALAMSEAEEYNINLVKRQLAGKLQIRIANQTFVYI